MSRITKLTGLFLLMSSCVICDITAEVDRCGLGQEDLRKRSGLCFTKVVLVVQVLSAEARVFQYTCCKSKDAQVYNTVLWPRRSVLKTSRFL